MTTVVRKERSIPVVGSSDVLIIGGGFAGIGAAVAASRSGKTVTLIERSIVLGGLGTMGHVCIYLPIDDGLGHKIYGGIAEELLYTTIKYGYNSLAEGWQYGIHTLEHPAGRYQTHFNIPACIMAFDELMEQCGVNVVFDARYTESIMEGNTCKGVIVETKSGAEAYLATMVIDASGDADVMARSGAACITQKSIVSHWAYEIDMDTLRKGLETGKAFDAFELRWIGLRPDADNSGSKLPMFEGTTSDGVNGYVKFSRKLALEFLKQHQDEKYAMLTVPTMAQFRTSRRIQGLREFPLKPDTHLDDSVGCVINCLQNPADVYEFPYGAIIDKELTNVLAAGRIVAAGGLGWEIMRYIPGCVFTGQVAGTAAAIALDHGCSVQDVPVNELQAQLQHSGVMIHMPEEVMNNHGKPSYTDPTASFDPHIRNNNLAYSPH